MANEENMKIIFFSIEIFFTSFLFSCSNKAAKGEEETTPLTFAENPQAGTIISEPEEILIDFKNGKEQLLDDFIESVHYVKLETTKENLIGSISQILFTDSLLIVADKDVAKTIFVFDRKGRFKNRIGRIGNGPGEYISINNIDIIQNNNQIAVYDNWKKTIHFYKINGEYLHSERNQFDVANVMFLPSGYRVFYVTGMSPGNANLNEYRDNTLIVSNTKNEVMYGACTDFYTAGKFHMVMNLPLRKVGENVYYSPNFSNMIYQVGDSCLTAKYFINIKGGMPPLTKDITDAVFRDLCEKHVFFNGDILVMKDVTFISFFAPKGSPNISPFVFYSHANKQVYYTKDESMNPLFIFMIWADTKAMYQENTVVVDAIPYRIIANKLHLYYDKKYYPLLDELFEGLQDDDNPVLFFYKLKTNLK